LPLDSALGGCCVTVLGLVARAFGETFAWGTIVVNVVGSLLSCPPPRSRGQAAEPIRWIARRAAIRPHRGEPLGLDGKVGAGTPDHRSRRGDRRRTRS
jgi:hypothetical protein